MKSVRSVRRKVFQRCHLAYFGRDSDQTASVKNEMFYSLEVADGFRKLGDLRPLARGHLRPRGKLASSVARRLLDQLIEVLPSCAGSILLLRMDPQLGPGRFLVLRGEAMANWSRNGVSWRLPIPQISEQLHGASFLA